MFLIKIIEQSLPMRVALPVCSYNEIRAEVTHVQGSPEDTVLFHFDLELANIILDGQGNITAVIDWECVSAARSWRATRVPEFTRHGARKEGAAHGEETPAPPLPGPVDNEARMSSTGSVLDGSNALGLVHLEPGESTQIDDDAVFFD